MVTESPSQFVLISAALEKRDFLKMLTFASKDDLALWSPDFFMSFLSPHIQESMLLITGQPDKYEALAFIKEVQVK